jgi:hypothetical protein
MIQSMQNRVFAAIGVAIVLFAIWPTMTLFNHPEPFILGLPPFVFFSLVVFVAVPALLFTALWRTK